MGWADSTRHVVILLACLGVCGLSGCYKSYVRAHVPRCEVMSEELLVYLAAADNIAVTYTADETIPYCAGIDALLDE